ncbi:hypothetical protein KK092_01550 [Curtobacterium flaccumfaciens pv. flaccumfaciens]|uniref:hypothetical protein n=1 Tax=Curtobacterium flaccumfaciens TaxID=2035 RepID=UPI001BDDD18D|nr:hypothetical protein [Curtobacterium flaccumfaciens]MBT1668055.1 hypothetical protein [Curtobacterium flaccumfaciens pv. flaccumfaciens]
MKANVTDWYIVANWDARPESADVIAARLVDTSTAIKVALPVFDGIWTVNDQNVDSADERSRSGIVGSSPYKVDGVAEPARGFTISLASVISGGSMLHASVTAGAAFQTIINKPNEFVVDFRARRFGEAVEIDLPIPPDERIRDLGMRIKDIWGDSDVRVEFG